MCIRDSGGTAETSTEDRRPAHIQHVRQSSVVIDVQVGQELVRVGSLGDGGASAGDRRRCRPSTNLLGRRLGDRGARRSRRRSLAEEVAVDDGAELRVDRPVAALAARRVRLLALDALEALVQRQIVSNRVLQHPSDER